MIYSADTIIAKTVDALDTEMVPYAKLMRPFRHVENISGTLIHTWGWPRDVIIEFLHASYRFQVRQHKYSSSLPIGYV